MKHNEKFDHWVKQWVACYKACFMQLRVVIAKMFWQHFPVKREAMKLYFDFCGAFRYLKKGLKFFTKESNIYNQKIGDPSGQF